MGGETEVVTNMFTSAQLTSITDAMNTAISNVLSMFVSLTPIMAVIAGVGFGIALVRGLFRRIGNGDQSPFLFVLLEVFMVNYIGFIISFALGYLYNKYADRIATFIKSMILLYKIKKDKNYNEFFECDFNESDFIKEVDKNDE